MNRVNSFCGCVVSVLIFTAVDYELDSLPGYNKNQSNNMYLLELVVEQIEIRTEVN